MAKKKTKSNDKANNTKKSPTKKKEVKQSKETKNKPKIDVNKVKNITENKLFLIAIPILLILIVMSVAFDVRSGPINLIGLDERVEANTYNGVRNIIASQVDSQYPNLNPQYREELISKEFTKVLESGRFNLNGEDILIADIVEQNVRSVKSSFKAENNQTYLNAIDPYSFMKLADNHRKNGHVGTSIQENPYGELSPHISYKLAPNGVSNSYVTEFHIWFESLLYKMNGITDDSTIGEKTKVIFLIPVFFAMLSVIPAYLIIRKFSNDFTAFLGTLFLVSVGTFVSRTIAGFVDTDAYNVFFPLLVLAFLTYGFMYSNRTLTIILSLIAGFFQGVYLWAWGSGWYLFIFIVASLIGYLGYLVFTNLVNKVKVKEQFNQINNMIFIIISYVLSSIIFTYVFIKENLITLAIATTQSKFSDLASISQTNIWPNVLSSVAELNNASFGAVIGSVGGQTIFIIALLGILLLSLDFKKKYEEFNLYNKVLIILSIIWFYLIIYKSYFVGFTANNPMLFMILLFLPIGVGLLFSVINQNTNDKVFIAILLSIWTAGTIYMSLNGVRFILLLIPAFAISFAMGLYYIANSINSFISKEMKVNDKTAKTVVGYIIVAVIFYILFSPIHANATNISKGTTPNFDDAWYSTMNRIDQESAQDSIITSWWDFGHFFATASNRGVTFDGGTQGTPRAHWVGKLLMEEDEKVSHDILRMLVCGGNEAHNVMLAYTDGENKDAVKINKIISNTLGKDIEETRTIIESNPYYEFTETQIDEIMNNLACENPPENFLITSQDMIGKAGVWAHWGSWDFTRKYVHDNYNTLSAEEIANDIDEEIELIERYVSELQNIDIQSRTQNIKREDLLNRWFADYPGYIPLQNRYTYPCVLQNTTLACQNGLNVDLITGNLSGPILEQLKINDLVLPTANGDISVITQDEAAQVDAIIIPSNGGFEVLLSSHPLGASLFTKLFYLDGFGTNLFEKFDDVQSVTGVRVKTWKVIWELNESETIGDISGIEVDTIEFTANEEEVKEILGDNFNNNSSE